MTATLRTLIEQARGIRMNDAQRAEQRISFAFGNIHLSGSRATREDVRHAAEKVTPPVIASPDRLRTGLTAVRRG